MSVITAVDTIDIRFPTSLSLAGSDAGNPDPDYSAACSGIRCSTPDAGTELRKASIAAHTWRGSFTIEDEETER